MDITILESAIQDIADVSKNSKSNYQKDDWDVLDYASTLDE